MTAYTIVRLTKLFGTRTVLDIPNLTIEDGSIYALLGPNGAGKTTLLNILGFLDSPTSGQINYHGKLVRFTEAQLQALRKKVVMVDQHPILFSTTVFKNLEFGLKIRRIAKKERERIIEETLDLVGMRSFIHAQAHRLSGGETQRVALARGLALEPRVFLCDEPTASVDIENQNIIINIIKQINETKKITILFTTHDRSQAAKLAHHTLVLDHGRLMVSVFENVFTGVLGHDSSGKLRCAIHDKILLQIPQKNLNTGSRRVRVVIDPEKINLIDIDDKACELNPIPGRVIHVMAENSRIRLVVDAGINIALLIPQKKYEQTRPLVGELVGVCIPSESIQILESTAKNQ
ncbi:MAG: ABC transporter ATP-binding protein [Desulfobacterales bacterium]